MSDYNENPLLLLLDPHHDERSKDLPVSLYESELHMVKDVPTHLFVSLPFKIETTEAERVSVDHVSKVSPAGEDGVSPRACHRFCRSRNCCHRRCASLAVPRCCVA